jgi:hypothetical protein
MSEHRATIEWRRGDAGFSDETYTRSHTLRFDDGIEVAADSPKRTPARVTRKD